MKYNNKFIFALLYLTCMLNVNAHEVDSHHTAAHQISAKATYLGNEAVMIQGADKKIIFDPFFHNDYKTYQLVPQSIRNAIFNGDKPYDSIDIIFISHAHGDHFSAQDMLHFLQKHRQTKMVAPQQAVDAMFKLKGSEKIKGQVKAIALNYGDKVWQRNIDDIKIEAVRIPHAGWPGRANVENIVFRVSLDDKTRVIHMGDADPDDAHFKPYKEHWQKKVTNTAFPPYWFFLSEQGNAILQKRINAKEHVGLHVPVKIPYQLQKSDKLYFYKPEQEHAITQL